MTGYLPIGLALCSSAGKSMMGKSSTVNSLFNEPVAQVTSFQQDTARPQMFKRIAAGFEMSVIDTPGLLDSDTVSTAVRLLTFITGTSGTPTLSGSWQL